MTTQHQDMLEVYNILGEGPVWDARYQCLSWTDIEESALYTYQADRGVTRVIALPERLGSFALTADPDIIIGAFASGFARFHISTGVCERIAEVEADVDGTRMNDGRVDDRGRFWAGTMVEDLERGTSVRGALYALAGSVVRQHVGDVMISNGLCFSPAGDTLYFADSPRRHIYAYRLHDDGSLSDKRLFAETPEGAYPDGAVVDTDGCLWSAHWGAGRVVRYTPDGREDRVLTLPVSQPTCPAFGGKDGTTLFVTTARTGLSDAQLAAEPDAGNVFIYELDVSGPPAALFADN